SLSLHDALPICWRRCSRSSGVPSGAGRHEGVGAAVADLAGGDPLALADRAPAGADLVEQQALAGGEFVFGGPERVLGGVEAVPEGGGDLDVDELTACKG